MDNQKALIVVDMVYDFVADQGRLTVGKPGQDLVPYIITQCNKMLESGGVVVFACDCHKGGVHGNWPLHCDPTTGGADLFGALKTWAEANKDNQRVLRVDKDFYSAFQGTTLAKTLSIDYGVDTVELVGVCTDICVLATAFGANYAGFKIRVHRNGVATFSKYGQAALDMMQQNFQAKIV